MFDISFTELMVIGMIALVVIGPERLPKVARTLGHLLGRAQRYVNDVKTDIKREMNDHDLGNLKNQFDEASSSFKESLADASKTISNPMLEAQKAVENAGKSLHTSMVDFDGHEAVTQATGNDPAVTKATEPASGTSQSAVSDTGSGPTDAVLLTPQHPAPAQNPAPEKQPAPSSPSNTGTTP